MSNLKMPDVDQEILARRREIASELRRIVPGEGVIDEAEEMRAYESDGLTAYKQIPLLVVLPETVTE